MRFSAMIRAATIGALLFVSACQGGMEDITTASVVADGSVRSDLQAGKLNYRSGNYGLAQEHFMKARTADPFNAEAWLGLAAAYDQLGRFDLADRAYRQTESLIGPAPQLLNNIGYSYLLRGDTQKARGYLERAAAALPQDETVRGNERILDSM